MPEDFPIDPADPDPPDRASSSAKASADESRDTDRPDRTDPDTAPTIDPGDPDPPDGASPRAEPRGPDLPGSGKTLGPYEILHEIGRGGMGVVYKAFHPGLKRTVALKVLIAGEDASEEAIARFHREAEAVAKLGHHPNIVPVYDIGRERKRHYFAMHYVEGKSLDGMIDDGEIAPKRAALLARKIAEALQHAHDRGVLHRDVKPANILVSREGEPQITDFGLAKDVESDSRMTTSGVTLGTPHYMPPEQADGKLEAIDARSDVYALGASLYEMLTFQPPFEGGSVMEIIRKVLLVDPVSPRKKNPMVDRDLETICLKCLEKRQEKRFPSAGALAEDLGRFLEGKSIEARPASLFEKLAKRARRNRAATAALFVLALVILAGAVGGALGLREWASQRRKADEAKGREGAAKGREKRYRELLAKGRAVSAVFRAADVELGDVLAQLKAHFNTPQSEEEVRKFTAHLWPRVDDFEENLPEGDAALAAWLALKGWFKLMGDEEEEALGLFEHAREVDRDVPYGFFFEAMLHFIVFLNEFPLPDARADGTGLRSNEPVDLTAEGRRSLRQIEALLEDVRKAEVWGEASAETIEAVINALRDVGAGRMTEAEDGLSKALGVPELAVIREEILLARAIVRYRRADFDGGLKDLDEVVSASPRNVDVLEVLAALQAAKKRPAERKK
jgi:predicted Ser/Thr protein kinase